jgi:hypothetical protein
MNDFYTLFDPSSIGYDKQSIMDLCDYYTKNSLWDDIYPGVHLNSKRYSEDFLNTDAKLIIDSFHPDLNITYKQAQLFQMNPGQKGILHKDTDRSAGVLFPITPVGDEFSPIMFFNEEKEFVTELNYSNSAIILNVLKYHNVKYTNRVRVNFQIDFHISYAEVVELYRNRNLFKSGVNI